MLEATSVLEAQCVHSDYLRKRSKSFVQDQTQRRWQLTSQEHLTTLAHLMKASLLHRPLIR